jgi:hypothetical protein
MALTKVDSTLVDGAINTTAAGNVGIGTSSPGVKLQIGNPSDSNQALRFDFSDSSTARINSTRVSSGNLQSLLLAGQDTMQFQTSGTERMRIDSSGRVTTPSQPAFCAKGIPSNVTSGVILFGSSSIPLNVGSSYSQATGRFTAPIAGNYLITVVGMAQTNFYTSSVRVNASEFAQFRTNDGSVGNYMQGTISLIIPLAASDYVDVSVGSGTFGGNAQEVIFAGYLLG